MSDFDPVQAGKDLGQLLNADLLQRVELLSERIIDLNALVDLLENTVRRQEAEIGEHRVTTLRLRARIGNLLTGNLEDLTP